MHTDGNAAGCCHLLLLEPHVCHLLLVLVMQPPQLLAVLLQVVVLPHELRVVPLHGVHLLLQLGLVSQEMAVQGAGGGATGRRVLAAGDASRRIKWGKSQCPTSLSSSVGQDYRHEVTVQIPRFKSPALQPSLGRNLGHKHLLKINGCKADRNKNNMNINVAPALAV